MIVKADWANFSDGSSVSAVNFGVADLDITGDSNLILEVATDSDTTFSSRVETTMGHTMQIGT